MTIVVNEEVSAYLQRLAYETDGLKVLHTHALAAGLDKDITDGIKREFMERYMEYEQAKVEFWMPYAEKYPNTRWHLNFNTSILTIEEKE